jgi:flagellar biosynthesis protein FlhG
VNPRTETRITPTDRRNFGNVVPTAGRTSYDQADGVRQLMSTRSKPARVVAVTSGKGGVGKTNVSVNLSIALSMMRKRVVLVDLELGLANADILMDLMPRWNLSSVIAGRKRVEEVIVAGPAGVRLVPGASGVERLANLNETERAMLLAGLQDLCAAADYVIFDTGAGISRNTTAFLAAADDVIVVTTPEPTAVVDAYAVIKLLALEQDRGAMHVLINMAQSRDEAERFANGIVLTANKLMNAYVARLGYILADRHVGAAVRQRRAFLLDAPGCPAAACVRSIADRLASGAEARGPMERPGFVRRLLSVFGR